MTGEQLTASVNRLMSDSERRSVFVAALVIGGLSIGWAIGSVAAGESLGAQTWLWLVAVLTGVGVTVTALLETDDS